MFICFMLQLMEGKSVPLGDLWKTSINWCSLWLVSCRCHHSRTFQKYTAQQSSQKSKTDWGSILDRPLPARTLMAPVLVCSGSLRMEADRAKLIKGVTMRNKPDPPPPPTLSSWWGCSWESPSKTPPWLQSFRPHPMAHPIEKRTQDLLTKKPS